MIKIMFRWLIFSLEGLGLIGAMYANIWWLAYGIAGVLTFECLSPFIKGYEAHLQQKMLDGQAFWTDFVPKLIVMPFCTAYAFENGHLIIAGISSLYWIVTLRKMRRLKEWKEVNLL